MAKLPVWSLVPCATLVIDALSLGAAQAQSVVPDNTPSQMQSVPQVGPVTPDAQFVGTTSVQIAAPMPPMQVRLAWKYANERLIATVAPVTGPMPAMAAYPRVPFKPATAGPTGPLQANPTFQPDAVNEPVVDTSHSPIPVARP